MVTETTTQQLGPLIELAHHRWNVPVIAELYRLSGAKFVTLSSSLNVSRSALSASLNDLIGHGLVERNPGHGHPMRPEYLLTQLGMAMGDECLSLQHLISRRDEQDVAYRKWTLPLVAAIGSEVRRFNEVQLLLPEATPRAITMGLKSLIGQRWAARSLIDDFPPTAGYMLLPKGRSVLDHVSQLF